MAIVKMLKMRLIGVNVEEDALLDALQRTACVHINTPENVENGVNDKQLALVKQKRERLAYCTDFLTTRLNEYASLHSDAKIDLYNSFNVSYAEFINESEREKAVEPVLGRIEQIMQNLLDNKATRAKLEAETSLHKPYLNLEEKFSAFKDTAHSFVKLGLIPAKNVDELLSFSEQTGAVETVILGDSDANKIVSIVLHKSLLNEVNAKLYSLAFTPCPFAYDYTAKEKIESIKKEYAMLDEYDKQYDEELYTLKDYIRDFKLLLDYYKYEEEKLTESNGFDRTKSTFLLEGFLPVEAKQTVERILAETSGAIYTQFEEVGDEDFAPTLNKNNAFVSQFEFVTDLYSPPKYGSIDPNPTLSIFFSVFMGFIMADMGYGLLMMLGFVLAKKIKGSVKKLCNVIAYGGIATFIFGFLFDSFFGFGILRKFGLMSKPLLPDPVGDYSSLAGISVPTLLLISLLMGVIQIMVSLALKGVLSTRRGNLLDGICDGFVWIGFLAGLVIVVLDMLGVTHGLLKIGAILTLACLGFAVIFAGRHEKFLGKFTKGFGSVYGIINYMSDILSYARLYGLMLSGAQIASIFTSLGLGLFSKGVGGIIGGVLVLIAGHAFNLAMGTLGAYIHDSRLQYIEYFGRFYEGEGVPFSPLGSKHDYVTVTK